MRKWIDCLTGLLFPRCCVVCQGPLSRGEKFICTSCLALLPRTNDHLNPEHPTEKFFWGRLSVEKASSFYYHYKGSDYNRIVYKLKYGHCRQIGRMMGRIMASELEKSGFFEGIDLIVPVPLHPKKERRRGYNQSEWIGRGVSEVTGIPLHTGLLIRTVHTPTQTRKTTSERWENVSGIFESVPNEKPEGKRVLLVDDVLTTGSTLLSAAQTLCTNADVKVSMLTLAVASF